ncbi:hypothetical protein SAMN04488505_101178 [Chitinophaga rupis]|uniref:DUF6265 domain-containing protein n=2 Tax=Chitinophaga rupis TaxID=573321 RepID=A0A1H7GXB7_9BACT|nr:hypothetical protein SAMN04488505_101178 [Chitinophaga rupis]
MRMLFLCYLFLMQTQDTAPEQFKKLTWLTGTWNRTNLKPGRSGHERWVQTNTYELKGWGLTLRGADTAFVEKLTILVKDSNLYYVADVSGNAQPVYFKCTAISTDGFVFENPAHDFPKRIEYKREGAQLKATISGNGKAVEYWFERQ